MKFMNDNNYILWSELVSMMYDRELDDREGKVLKVLYSRDSTKRYVISEHRGMYTYELEVIERLEDDEWNYICDIEGALPAQWVPYHKDCRKSLFENMDDLIKELEQEPEYIKCFQ